MHGAVCLFSNYMEHLLNGENLEELDISSASSSDNIFSNQNTLSTGWKGTCPLVNFYDSIHSNYSTQFNSLVNIFTSQHNSLLDSYNAINSLFDTVFTIKTTTVSRPSAIYGSLTPKFESEFSDRNNKDTIGGKIYSDFLVKIKPYVEILNTTIKNGINNFEKNDEFTKNLDWAYENFVNFDQTVADASSVINKYMIDLKDYFLTWQFNLMFFTWGFMFFFVLLIFFYIIYNCCKESNFLWYIIIILVHILLILMLLEILMSSFFGQFRLICHEIPKAMNFIFTGTYITSGNSASYPAKFGTGNTNMTTMFTHCLNGNGNLTNLFLSSNNISSLNSLRNTITNLYLQIKQIVENSNLVTTSYNNLENSLIYQTILNLETTKKNIYMATEGFGEDDIFTILRNIRTYLDFENCSMTEEYYVVREADCPYGSVQMTTLKNVSGIVHCYVIPNLYSGSQVSYSNAGCQTANRYINLAIPFIVELKSMLDYRSMIMQMFQIGYSSLYNSLYNEITALSNYINSTDDLINSNKDESSIANCGSVRFDLIDFCDLIGDTTEYDAKIVLIFSAFVGVFGYVMLYFFLVVINSFTYNENDYDDDDYVKDSSKNKNKIRNINNNVYKAKPIKRETVDDEEEEEEDEKEDIKKKMNNKTKNKIPVKTGQKVEMSYLSKNNDDSDSS